MKHFVVTTMDDNYGQETLFVSHLAAHALKWFEDAKECDCDCIYHENFVPTLTEVEFNCPVPDDDADPRVSYVVKIDGIEVEGCDHRLGKVWFK